VALTLLQYSIQNRQGFTVISGEVGCGKTTLINRLLGEIDQDLTIGLINFTHNSFSELAEWIMMAFGLEYKGKSKVELYDDFVKFLIREYAAGRPVVLIVDEAQNMGVHGLEEVRMLSNVNAQKEYLLHLVLVGQPELRDLLQLPELRQLAQRVSVAYHLSRLNPKDVHDYITHRMTVAGAAAGIFTEEAIRIIAHASEGVPRLINTFCDLALVYGFSESRPVIDHYVMRSVIQDRVRMGLSVGRLRRLRKDEPPAKVEATQPSAEAAAGYATGGQPV
jgi:type II secretory pathway predicted ATPase ExeA